jgi:hypothetical protein
MDLFAWQTPQEMNDFIDAIKDRSDFLYSASVAGLRSADLRTAYTASAYGRMIGASRLRLLQPPAPDAELEMPDRTVTVETVELLEPGRKRGDEYRRLESGASEVPESSELNFEAMAAELALQTSKKLGKSYDRPCGLVIYGNMRELMWLGRDARVEAMVGSAIQHSATKFQFVAIVMSGQRCLVWTAAQLKAGETATCSARLAI